MLRGHDSRDSTCLPAQPQAVEALSAKAYVASSLSDSPLRGVRVGLPRQCDAPAVHAAIRELWHSTAQTLTDAGAEVVEVSLPAMNDALSAYYIIASAEAASNLARYDGLRYGYRTNPSGDSTTAAAVSAVHQEYSRTRAEGFGEEVQRRVLLGNFVLSQSAKGEYYDNACRVRAAVAQQFQSSLRSSSSSDGGGVQTAEAVDVLLMPTTPSPPWAIDAVGAADPTEMYANDILTVPVNLAGEGSSQCVSSLIVLGSRALVIVSQACQRFHCLWGMSTSASEIEQ